MKLFHENPFFETVKSKVIISLFETVRLSVSISPRNLYNLLNSIKEKAFTKDLGLSLVMFLMASFCAVLFPRDVLDEIWDLIESISEGFPTYSCNILVR